MSLLSVDNVTHRYPTTTSEIPVLNGVSLEVQPGSVVAVVGESGCGKTTLGRLVVGLVQPMEGEVRYEGKDIWAFRRTSGTFIVAPCRWSTRTPIPRSTRA